MELQDIINCPNCNEKYTEVYMLPCLHYFCSKCTNLMQVGSETTCLLCSRSCNQDEVKRNPYLEKIFAINKKIENNKNELLICEICSQDDTKNSAEKYCVDCEQYICDACSIIHVKSKSSCKHEVVDKNNNEKIAIEPLDLFCNQHKQNLNIYCKKCDIIICSSCCIVNKSHQGHEKSDDLKKAFAKSNLEIQNKISMIHEKIEDQSEFIKQNKQLEISCRQNCDKVRNEINNYSKELRSRITGLTNHLVSKIDSHENDYIKSALVNVKEINDYFSLLKNTKLHLQEVIDSGSNIYGINLNNELNKNNFIESNKPKLISKTELSFEIPSLFQLISSKILESLKFEKVKDNANEKSVSNLNIKKDRKKSSNIKAFNQIMFHSKTKNSDIFRRTSKSWLFTLIVIIIAIYMSWYFSRHLSTNYMQDLEVLRLNDHIDSVCFLENNIYTSNIKNKEINIYNKEIKNYNSFIKLNDFIYETIKSLTIFNVRNNVFLFYRSLYTSKLLMLENNNFYTIKTINKNYDTSLTFQQTFLVRIQYDVIIELSTNGYELKRIQIPPSAFLLRNSFQLYHQLKDGRYIFTSYNSYSVLMSLLDTKGNLIKSFTPSLTVDIKTCTDGVNFIFVLELKIRKITVFSTDLNYLHEFIHTGVIDISYDAVNNKLILIKEKEIVYFTYNLPF